jgi:magnesium transporter
MTDAELSAKPASMPQLRDEEGHIDPAYVALVSELIEAGEAEALRALDAELHEADTADLLEALNRDLRPPFVQMLGPVFDFAALTELDETVRADIVDQLSTETLVAGLRELDSDDAVYILEDLDEARKAEILDRLPAPERVMLQRSLDLPEHSAGRRMQSDFIAVPPFWTVGQLIDHLREAEDLPTDFYDIFVVDPGFRLIGTVPLDKLLRAKRRMPVREIIDEDLHSVKVTEDQEEAARLFERYNLVSAPVVDDEDRLVGVLTVDDVVDVIEEEADEDLRALGGIVSDEELSDTVAYTARSRIPWLLVNTCTAFISASVIGLFEGTIAKMVALAVLMPIVASMGGNAGTQAMTVTVRAIATRELGVHNARRVLFREILVGFFNGLIIATVVGSAAAVWFWNPTIGGVIGAALVCNMVIAGTFGVLVPLTLHRLGADPAVASSVFLTMTTDVMGYLAFLGLATWWLGLL